MAASTYAQLKKQIAALEIQAAKQKTAELSGVVAKIKESIAMHGLTAEDLFGSSSGKAPQAPRAKAGKTVKGGAGSAAKYSNGEGGVWGGRGKRPQWLRDALATGRKMEDFIAKSGESVASSEKQMSAKPASKNGGTSKRAGKAGKKSAGWAKYSDGAGHSWSGMGPKPKWFKDAIAAGKTPEELGTTAPAA